MREMTSRERFRRALNHLEPDRIPIDVGQDFHNGLHEVAYRNLLQYLGETDDIQFYDQVQHLAVCKESVLNRLRADTRYVFAGAEAGYELRIEPDKSWWDEWGVRRKNIGFYDDNIAQPLAGCTLEDIKKYRMPNPTDPARFVGLRERAKTFYDHTSYAVMGGNAASLFYLSSELMGYQEYMERLVYEPDLIEALVDRILEWEVDFFNAYLEEVGDVIEVVWMGDDWGIQTGPIMSPKMFRKIFKDRYRIFIDAVRKKTNAKVALHSCGSVLWIMGDLIDVGIDVLHPLQATAAEMGNPARIKEMYGDRLVFYSNISNQSILPQGTPDEVRAEAKNKIKYLAPGGGYIFSAGHNIQADVPPENIIALFDTAYQYGRYPIG
ncbi:MAG: hypothetical protein NTX88_06925 [Candidatus Atribacteria bacterium]|nr:hypothetical protein [Candidatus Atribacteria bacterium]